MSSLTRMRRGWHLGFQSLKIVFRDKTLLLFPLLPFTTAIAVIVSFCLVVGPDKLFWALFVVNTLEHARYLALGYVGVAIVSTFFSLGLVACVRITLDGQDSKFLDGAKAALKKSHWVILWALIAWTIGPILNLLDHLRYTSRWVRKILKTSWSQLSYFLLPILVVDNINMFSALRRSTTATAKTWGEGAVSQLGFMWFFFFMNIPTIALFAYGHYLEGPWPKPLTFVVLSMVYGSIIVYQTLSAVLSVVLYKYTNDGAVLSGFKESWMEKAFAPPKMYVLVDPNQSDVHDVPPPAGVDAGEADAAEATLEAAAHADATTEAAEEASTVDDDTPAAEEVTNAEDVGEEDVPAEAEDGVAETPLPEDDVPDAEPVSASDDESTAPDDAVEPEAEALPDAEPVESPEDESHAAEETPTAGEDYEEKKDA